jgi:type II secretory pathway component GspD/PulD (secretin)
MMVHRQKIMDRPKTAIAAALALAALCLASIDRAAAEAFGQPASGEAVFQAAPAGAPPNMSPEQMKAMEEARAKAAAGGQPQPGQPGAKPGEGEKKPEGDGDKKKEDGEDTVKRPDAPPKPPNPDELKVALDEHGRVPPFNFIGQPWPDVMQWIATLSNLSFDFQELPSGYLNLTTDHSYPLEEVRDILNARLLARGFTSIQVGEVLSVVKLDKLDPASLRLHIEDDLLNLKPHDYVKVAFELPADMEVEKAKDDVKQILSPHAKVFPLVTTRRLYIMDSVANLRTVSELFNQERMIQDGRIVPNEFVLKHARPDHVIEILKTMVGTNQQSQQPPMTPEQQQQQQQMMEQARQRGQNPPKMPGQAADAPKVYLAMNRRRNSVLVNAPPAQMKIIKQTIEYLDVPFGEEEVAGIIDNGGRSLVKYNLVTMDPEQLKLTLEEIGELDPRTELRADTKSKILFARATVADHEKIAALKDELDGTGRGLHQIWLPRRLPADAVAGTILALMGGQEQEEEEENDYPFFFYRRNNDDDDKPKKGFRVDADIENNRILLWANDAEFREVEGFIAELSKASPAQQAQRTVRTIDASDPEDTAKILEQLRKVWPTLGENEIIINDERPKEEPEKKKTEESDDTAKTETADRQAAAGNSGAPRFQLVQLTTDDAAESADDSADAAVAAPDESAATKKAPINVTVTKDGRIVIASKDTEALDLLQQFIGQTVPQGQRWKIFKIRYADVYDVYLNLKEFYEDELKGERSQVLDWWGYMQDAGPKDGSLLSKRPPLRLIWDPDSNTILVANASGSQLAEIEHLIKQYDQPQPEDAATERVTRPVKIQYSKASTIVTSLKEVFRDLLSSKDKEFDQKDGQKSSSGSNGITVLRYSMGGSSDSNQQRSAPVKVGFQGALSLGADDVSNIVLVSAQKDVFELVNAMIQKLDQEAAPQTTVQVHRVVGNVRADALQKALDQAVGQAWLGNRPEQTGSAGDGDNDNNRRDRDRNRGDRRRDRDND